MLKRGFWQRDRDRKREIIDKAAGVVMRDWARWEDKEKTELGSQKNCFEGKIKRIQKHYMLGAKKKQKQKQPRDKTSHIPQPKEGRTRNISFYFDFCKFGETVSTITYLQNIFFFKA